MRGEFHIHTVYSDGALSVDEVLTYLKGNLDYFSITDHDYIDGSVEAFHKAQEYGLKSIIGVEVSTYLNDESVHILGYFKDDKGLEVLKDKLAFIANERVKRLYIIKDRLMEYFNIDLDVTNLLKKHSITRGSIAREIIKQGYNYTIEELFKNVIGKDCKAYYQSTKITPIEAINLIHKCHGLAVLAHPVLLTKNKIDDMLEFPFDGIEAIYPTNTKNDEEMFKKKAKEKNLFITCGNDFHYFGDPMHADLLTLALYDEELEIFIRKVNELK